METEIPQSPGPVELRQPETQLLVSHRQLNGVLAMWAITLNPIFPPRNLMDGLMAFHEATKPRFEFEAVFTEGHTPTIPFHSRNALRHYISEIFEKIPAIQDWNKTQNEVDGKVVYPTGHSQFQIVSSFDPFEASAQNDFVDLGALARNVSNYFHFEAERNQAFEVRFANENPQPAPITEAYPIFMREDGELPTEQKEETFEEWVNRVADNVPMLNDLTSVWGTKWISRVDGGFMGITPNDFAWLFKAGIRERIQMMDAEEGKTACIGFNPSEQRWYGWARGCASFGIGSIAEVDNLCTQTGWDNETLLLHPEKDYRVPIGFEAKTLVDAKRMAIAFAESNS